MYKRKLKNKIIIEIYSLYTLFHSRTKRRWSVQVTAELARQFIEGGKPIAFGEIVDIPAETTTEIEMKSVKNRPPTPVVKELNLH